MPGTVLGGGTTVTVPIELALLWGIDMDSRVSHAVLEEPTVSASTCRAQRGSPCSSRSLLYQRRMECNLKVQRDGKSQSHKALGKGRP